LLFLDGLVTSLAFGGVLKSLKTLAVVGARNDVVEVGRLDAIAGTPRRFRDHCSEVFHSSRSRPISRYGSALRLRNSSADRPVSVVCS